MIGAVTNTETVTLSFATATSDVPSALEEITEGPLKATHHMLDRWPH